MPLRHAILMKAWSDGDGGGGTTVIVRVLLENNNENKRMSKRIIDILMVAFLCFSFFLALT